jgi:8-oxo-dGTP pyrophosphatase MutT (NUDIX family)
VLPSAAADGKGVRGYCAQMPWRRRFEPIFRPAFKMVSRLTRGMTLGVRGLVLNDAGEVLLLQHTYVKGWYMPGGGVERGEAAEEALERELVEEAGVRITAPPRLLGVYTDHVRFRGDHVLLYRIEGWEACEATSRGEIAELRWFAPDALPHDASRSTERWLAEHFAPAPEPPED